MSRGPVVAADLSEPDVGKPLHAITMGYVMWLKGLVILATGAIAEAAFAPAPAPAGELPLCPARILWPGTHLSHSEWPVTACIIGLHEQTTGHLTLLCLSTCLASNS